MFSNIFPSITVDNLKVVLIESRSDSIIPLEYDHHNGPIAIKNLTARGDNLRNFLKATITRSFHYKGKEQRATIHAIDTDQVRFIITMPIPRARAWHDIGIAVGASFLFKNAKYWVNTKDGTTYTFKLYDNDYGKIKEPIIDIETRGFPVAAYTSPSAIIQGKLSIGSTVPAVAGLLADVYKTV